MYPKIILAALAAVTIATLTTPAEAQPRQAKHHPAGWVDVAAIPSYPLAQSNRRLRAASRVDANGSPAYRKRWRAAKAPKTSLRSSNGQAVLIDKPQEYLRPSSPSEKLVTREAGARGVCRNNRGSTSLARVVEPLKSKAQEIVRECGAHIVSTDCRGGATPNHRLGLAVDIAMRGRGSPACIYAHLKGWPGGVSTDYWTAPGTKHVHFSYNRRHEWGLRFTHSRSLYGAISKFKKHHARVAKVQ